MTDYVLNGTKWGSPTLGTASGQVLWSFALKDWGGYSFDQAISDPTYQALVRQAFDMWERVTNIDFVETTDANAQLRLGWDRIDGLGNQLGETTAKGSSSGTAVASTTSAEIRLDLGELWSTASQTVQYKTNFYAVVLHEIGHALGLDHTDNTGTIMYPLVTELHNLSAGDIVGAQALYGVKVVVPTSGNDAFLATVGNDSINGLGGRDSIYFSAAKQNFAVTVNASNDLTVTGQGSDHLVNIERLQFTDGTLAFDLDGNAGQAYRIYQAAFDRTPDTAGLAYWINSMDAGTSLIDVSSGFIASREFASVYGANSTNATFVDKLYEHVLGRDGEAAGITYWNNQLAAGEDRAHVLANFSESAENIQGVSAAIHDGIWYA